MNFKEFAKVLRQIIREEVQEAVQTEFAINQVLSERKAHLQPTVQSATKQPYRYTESMKPKQPQPQRPRVQKDYSENTVLNSILKQTAEEPISGDFAALLTEGVDSTTGEFEDYPTMLGGMRVSGQEETFRYQENLNLGPSTDTEGRPSNPTAIPDVVFNAMNRDYSKVLKAAKEKSKIGR